MTQQGRTPDSHDAPQAGVPSDAELRMRWYRFAAAQPGSVESLLAILRTRQGQSEEEQQAYFSVGIEDFARLQSLRLPRPEQFTSDAERIASACHVGRPFEFVQALLLARSIKTTMSSAQTNWQGEELSYEAAYDAADLHDEMEDDEPEGGE